MLEHMFALAAETPLAGIARITREIAALEAERIALAHDYERSNAWAAKYRSPSACDRVRMQDGRRRRAGVLSLGETLELLPQTAEAFAAGEISRQSANAIAKAATSDRVDGLVEVEVNISRSCADIVTTRVARRRQDRDRSDRRRPRTLRRRTHVSTSARSNSPRTPTGCSSPPAGSSPKAARSSRPRSTPRWNATSSKPIRDRLRNGGPTRSPTSAAGTWKTNTPANPTVSGRTSPCCGSPGADAPDEFAPRPGSRPK